MDIIVVGTGVSAMLLAQSLIDRKCFRSLRLIGRRQPLRAHRIAFWNDAPTPFDAHTDARWSQIRIVDSRGMEHVLPLNRFEYRSFHPQQWFDDVSNRVLSAPGVEWIEERVESLESSGARAVVDTGANRIEGDWVFTSVRFDSVKADCFQRFEGWEVELANDIPDLSPATLMDFRTAQEGDFRFIYMLPIAPRRMFIEHVSYQPCHHGDFLTTYMNDVLRFGRWRVIDREHGATPTFAVRPPRRHERIVNIGVAGGLAKAATGYALLRMWRDAETIADGLRRNGQPSVEDGPTGLFRLADMFFVDQVNHDGSGIPSMLATLFTRSSGDSVLAFLDDRANIPEQARIALAMPGWLRWAIMPRARRSRTQ